MSDYHAKRFIEENTADRREPEEDTNYRNTNYNQKSNENTSNRRVVTPDTTEDPAPLSEYAVIDPETNKTEGVANRRTAEEIATRRGHHVLIRNQGTYIPGAPKANKDLNIRKKKFPSSM